MTIELYGSSILREVCDPIEDLGSDMLMSLVRGMKDAMNSKEGAGLAAPQVGFNERMFVLNEQLAGRKCDTVICNPVLLRDMGKDVQQEGCLSVPGFFENVERSRNIEFEYFTAEGIQKQVFVSGFLARCIQHEMDHLDGKLFVDYLNKDRQKKIEKAMRKLRG
jgi:peptide deformylase